MQIRFFSLFFLLILNALAAKGQVLSLPARSAYAPTRFYVTGVADDRAEKGGIGTRFEESTPRPVAVPLTLAGDTESALARFLKTAVRPDTSRWAVVVRVKTLRFSEKLGSPSQAEGTLSVKLAFEVLRNGVRSPLTEYEGGGRFSRPLRSAALKPTDLQETLLRQTLESSLRYLDQWLVLNGPTREALARSVRIRFRPGFTGPTECGDTVHYDVRRPLRWDDFKAAPRSGKNYGAAVFSSFGYEATARTVAGVVEVSMAVKVYQLKDQSWAWPAAKNDYALRHEQLHFDITRLVAERFKQKIGAEALEPDEYDARIQFIFLDSFREMNKLQEEYDDETAHSINRAAQARWDAKITAALNPLLTQNH